MPPIQPGDARQTWFEASPTGFPIQQLVELAQPSEKSEMLQYCHTEHCVGPAPQQAATQAEGVVAEGAGLKPKHSTPGVAVGKELASQVGCARTARGDASSSESASAHRSHAEDLGCGIARKGGLPPSLFG